MKKYHFLILSVLIVVFSFAVYLFLYGTAVSPGELAFSDIRFDRDNGTVTIGGDITSSAKAFRSARMQVEGNTLFLSLRSVLTNPFYPDGHFRIDLHIDTEAIERIVVVAGSETIQIYPE